MFLRGRRGHVVGIVGSLLRAKTTGRGPFPIAGVTRLALASIVPFFRLLTEAAGV
jgi:hypothetical protein